MSRSPLSGLDHPAPGLLRLMTYNTHHGANRAGVLDLEAIASTVEACTPDVVALQEVDRHWGERSDHRDQPTWYAQRLGMELHYSANVVLPRPDASPPGEYGLALLSRLPIRTPQHLRYTGGRRTAEPRGLQTVLLGHPDPSATTRRLRVINTHLSVTDGRLRRRQVAELLSYADADRDLPTAVAGDFNAGSRSAAVRAMRSVFTDAWDAGRGPKATMLGRRIDYLWLSRHLRPVRTTVVRSRASDHFAVVSDVAWASSPASAST